MAESLDLILTASYALVAGLITALDIPPAPAAICLTPLVLFAPGYAIARTIESPTRSAGLGKRWLYAVALSMASVVLGGLLLNALFSLTTRAWAIWLVSLTCAFSVAGLVRDQRTRPIASQDQRFHWWFRRRLTRLSGLQVAALVASGLAVAASVILNELSARNFYNKPVTQLAILPYPNPDSAELRLAVTNLSDRVGRFTLIVTRGGRVWRSQLVVDPTKTWTREVATSGPPLTAFLVRAGETQPVSEVTWNG